MNGNLGAVCRLCLQSGGLLQDLFNPAENFVTIVEEFTGLEILQEPSFPSNVCSVCLAHIDTLNNFKKTCLTSEKALRDGLVVFEIQIVDEELKSEEQPVEPATAEDVKVNVLAEVTLEIDPLDELKPESLRKRHKTYEKHFGKATAAAKDLKVKKTTTEKLKKDSYEDPDPLDLASNSKPKPPRKKYNVRSKSEKQLAAATKKSNVNKKAARALKMESYEADNPPNETSNSEMKPQRKKYDACLTPCHICGKLYPRQAIAYHLNVHAGSRPFACPFKDCGKTFTSPMNRNKHRRTCHTDNFRFACDVCDRSFKIKTALVKHRSYHFDPELPCSVCGKLLRNRDAIARHMMTHTGERPYPCSECSKSFQNNYTLKIHQRVHTKEKPFTCAICATSFSYKCLLKTHMASSHPETGS